LHSRSGSTRLSRRFRRVPLAGILLLAGCVSPGDSSQEMAERYAQQERQSIDRQSFQQARERSYMQRDARDTGPQESAPPLHVDEAIVDRWQFGLFDHPSSGEPACAALSGQGEPVPAAGEPVPRLLVLADRAWVISDVPLAADRIESAVRIDAGPPIPLEVSSSGLQAALAGAQRSLLERLRAGSIATLRVTMALLPRPGGSIPTEYTEVAREGGHTVLDGAAGAVERVLELDRLPPLLDELVRCAGRSISGRADEP